MPENRPQAGHADPAIASPLHLGRRSMACALAALPLLARHAVARATPGDAAFDDGATLLVAGSERGRLDRWAGLMSSALGRGLPAGTVLRRQLAGGDDGVSGANQFEARATPDGQTALLLPGDAPLAWLAGDPRVHFDATRWVPVMAGWTPGLVVSRVPLGNLPTGASLRIAAADPAGADLAALLGLELLGVEAAPLFRLDDFRAARSALAARTVDAVFLHGEGVPRHAAAMAAAGMTPIFSLGLPDGLGGLARDPLFADVPTLPELLGLKPGMPGPSPLYGAWRAAAAAAQIDFALVLPQLTPAAMVALWRRAVSGLPGAHELQPAWAEGVRTLASPPTITASLAPDAASLLDLRRWLAERYNWQPA